MSIKSGKPGTIRVRGIQRAQLQRIVELGRSLVAYDLKLLNRNPPILFMNNNQLNQFQTIVVVAQQLLDMKN